MSELVRVQGKKAVLDRGSRKRRDRVVSASGLRVGEYTNEARPGVLRGGSQREAWLVGSESGCTGSMN